MDITEVIQTESTGPEVDYANVTNDMFTSTAGTEPEVKKEAAEEVETPEVPKADVPKVEEAEKAEEPEKPALKNLAAPKQEEVLEKADKPSKADKRDYTGFTEQEVKVLKKVPNEIFNWAKQTVLQQREELNKLKEDANLRGQEQAFMAPDAYTLSPEYKAISNVHENLDVEVDYWREQLKRAEKGQSVHKLSAETADMTQPMKYKVGAAVSKDEAKAFALEQLTVARARLEQVSTQRDGFKDHYAQQHKAFTETASKAASQYFPDLDTPTKEQQAELSAIRHSLGPHGRGFSGELMTRLTYVLKQALDQNNSLKAEINKSKKQIETVSRADRMRFSTPKASPAEAAEGDDIYAGVTNDMFRQ